MSASGSGTPRTLRRSPRHLPKRSPSVQQLKEEIRKQFAEKQKLKRFNQQLKGRNLYNNILSDVKKHFKGIDPNLLADDGTPALTEEEMYQMVVEVEKELEQKTVQEQVDQYALDMENLVDNTTAWIEEVIHCSCCNERMHFEGGIIDAVICKKCTALYFKNENL